MDKKNSQFKIRLSADELDRFKAAAEAKGLEPSKAIRDLMAAFAQAVEEHGARNVIWPVELDHFPADAKSAKELRYEGRIVELKVADADQRYGDNQEKREGGAAPVA